MLLSLFSKIPIIKALFDFDKTTHMKAIRKFGILWFSATLPLILAVFLSTIPETRDSTLSELYNIAKNSFSVSEIFVYAAAFLSPVLYIIFERYHEASAEDKSKQKKMVNIRNIFPGYPTIFLLSALTLLATSISYSINRVAPNIFGDIFLSKLISDGAIVIYIFSLYCWYLSILDGLRPSVDFVGASRRGERKLSQDFESRMKGRGDE